jgi:3-deoxy-D-manno-octulosonic acid (KDO) 8-phosphate synthase
MQHINSALRAHVLFHKDDNYIVDGDEVASVVDMMQTPAFLVRQTNFIQNVCNPPGCCTE